MKKAATAAAILAASIVALTGCATAPSPVTTVTVVPVIAAPDSTPSVEARNPVELAKKIDGCELEEDASVGNRSGEAQSVDGSGVRSPCSAPTVASSRDGQSRLSLAKMSPNR